MFLPPAPPKAQTTWFLGLDLAQRQDFTTLALLNLGWRKVEQDRATWEWIRKPELTLCALDRYPQGDSYLAYCNMVERRIDQIRAAEQNLLAQEAALKGAEWNLSQKKQFARQSALVSDTLYRQGDINFIVNGEPKSRAQRFAREHGGLGLGLAVAAGHGIV